MASTLGLFVIPQRIFLAWMPSINKKCHQNHFLGVLEIIGCRLFQVQNYLPFSILKNGVSKHYAGSQASYRCQLGYLIFSTIVCNNKSNYKGHRTGSVQYFTSNIQAMPVDMAKLHTNCHITDTKYVSGVYSIDVNA